MGDAERILRQQTGALLLRLAVTVQTAYRGKIGASAGPYRVKRTRTTKAGPKGSRYTAYKSPSRPCEYLKKRTGHLQAGILYEPTTADAAGRAGEIRIGYAASVRYGGIWELRGAQQRRKGLIDLVAEMRGELQAVAVGTRGR